MEKGKIKKLADKYFEYERRLIKELRKLKNAGKDCDCEEPERIEMGAYMNPGPFCLNCGGSIAP